MQKISITALIVCFLISSSAFAQTQGPLLRISYQASYAESSMKEPFTEFSVPIAFGYQHENLSFGIDAFSVQSPRDGNDTLFIESKTNCVNLFFEFILISHKKLNVLAGLAAGAAQTETQTTLVSGSSQNTSLNKSAMMSYNNLQISAKYNINGYLSVGVTALLQNSVLLNPNWQPGLRSSLQMNF